MNKVYTYSVIFLALITILLWSATPAGVTLSSQAVISAQNKLYVRTSNIVTTIVRFIHGLDLNVSDAQTVLPGETLYFAKTLFNVGNVLENIGIGISYPVTWNVNLIVDDNGDGVHQNNETFLVPPAVSLAPTSSYKFFVAVTAPEESSVTGVINLAASISAASLGRYIGFNNVVYGGPAVVSAAHTVVVADNTGDGSGPLITDLKFDDILVVNGDYIGINPLITAKVLDVDGVVTGSIKIRIDGVLVTESITFEGDYLVYKVTKPLGNGSHTFVFECRDTLGNTTLRTFIGEITSKTAIVGRVLPFPNPYDPKDGPLKITYQLTVDTSLKLIMYSITGEKVWQVALDAGREGAHRGYNEVLWEGLSGIGTGVGNGVYLVYIVSNEGKVLGKSKIIVIR